MKETMMGFVMNVIGKWSILVLPVLETPFYYLSTLPIGNVG